MMPVGRLKFRLFFQQDINNPYQIRDQTYEEIMQRENNLHFQQKNIFFLFVCSFQFPCQYNLNVRV